MNPTEPTTWQESVRRIAARMTTATPAGLSPGEMAELRRMDPSKALPAAYWRLVVRELAPAEIATPEQERRWALILAGMARLAPHPHRPGRHLGRVLAETGIKENRLLKLLHSQGPAFADAVGRVCRWLAIKGEAVDWIGFAALIREDPSRSEVQRAMVAKDYYSAQELHSPKEAA